MQRKSKVYKIAVINANEDIVEAIELALNSEGYLTVGAHLIDFKRGRRDFLKFIDEEKPALIILDVAPPYDENWRYYKLLQSNEKLKDMPFIITTTNETLLKKSIDEEEINTIEIMGKPFDLHIILEKVEKILPSK